MKIGRLHYHNEKWYIVQKEGVSPSANLPTFIRDKEPMEVAMSYRFPFGIAKNDFCILEGMVAIADQHKFSSVWFVEYLEIDL